MVRLVDIPNVGVYEYPDDMSDEDINNDVYDTVIPNADPANPDPEQVRARPDLFPDIDRGSFGAGFGSVADRYGRLDEVAGAAIGRSQESLDELKQQQAEDAERNKYRANLDDVENYWDRGDYGEAAGTLFGDIVPQMLAESLPDMGLIWAGGKAGAIGGAAVGSAVPGLGTAAGGVIGGIGGMIVGGMPSFFGMNVERQVQARDITDPDDIDTGKAIAAGAGQALLEGTVAKVLGRIPGVNKLSEGTLQELIKSGGRSLATKEVAKNIGRGIGAGVGTESVTETLQQVLERAQAGLDISPADEEALSEYIESAILGGLLGGIMGGPAAAYGSYRTKQQKAKAYDQIQDFAEMENAYLDAQTAAEKEAVLNAYGFETNEDGKVVSTKPLALTAAERTNPNITPDEVEAEVTAEQDRAERLQRNQNKIHWEATRLEEEVEAAKRTAHKSAADQEFFDNMWGDLNQAKEDQAARVYTVAELEEVDLTLAQHVVDMGRENSRSDPEGDSYVQSEVEAAAERLEGGMTPDMKESLQKVEMSKRPAEANIQPEEIIELAKSKNIKTEGRSFGRLVDHISGAKDLKEATPYERKLVKDALTNIQKRDKPYDPLPARDQSYSHDNYLTAIETVNESANKVFNATAVQKATGLKPKQVAELRDDLVKAEFLREDKEKTKAGKTTKKYRASRMKRVKMPSKTEPSKSTQPEWVDILEKDFLANQVPEAAVEEPLSDFEEGIKDDYVVRERPNGRAIVVATPKEGDMQADRVISVHDSVIEAEVSANRYRKTGAGTTDAELREQAAPTSTPAQYKAYQDRNLEAGLREGPVLARLQAAMEDLQTRRGLQAAGIPIEIVENVKKALGKTSEAPEGTEGAYEPNQKIIFLGLDMAVREAEKGTPADQMEAAVMQRLAEVLSHEQIHALIAAKVLGKSDMKILTRMATTKTRPEGFRMYGEGQTKWTYMDDVKASQPNLTTSELEEEAVAELFRDWARDPSVATGKPASLFRKIVKFFTTLGGFLKNNGARNVSDIFGEIDTGTLQGDGAQAASSSDPKLSVKTIDVRISEPGYSDFVEFEVLEDPRPTDILRHMKKIKDDNQATRIGKRESNVYPTLRYTYDVETDKIFVWNADTAIHRQVRDELNLAQGVEGEFNPEYGAGNPILNDGWITEVDGEIGVYSDAPAVGSNKYSEIVKSRVLRETPKFSVAPPINSAAFKKWFGDSKVVDANGDPLVVYHGTSSDIEEFDGGRDNINYFSTDSAFAGRFASMRRGVTREADTFPNVMPVYLSLQKLWDFRNPDDLAAAEDFFVDANIKMDEPGNAAIGGSRDESFIFDFGDDIDGVIDSLGRGEFGIVENGRFVDEFLLRNKYQGFTVVESSYQPSVTQARGTGYETVEDQVNYGVFKAERVKSVLNQGTFDSTNPNIRFSVARAMSDTELHDEVGKVEAAFYEEVSPEVQAYHDEVMREDADRRIQAAERDQVVMAAAYQNTGRVDRPYMRRYGVKVWTRSKETGEYETSKIQHIFAKDQIEAATLAASSSAINREATRVDEPYLDDPNWDADKNAPKFSVRRWSRVLTVDEYREALRFVPIRPSKVNKAWGEYTQGMAWLDTGEPLPVVLLQGHDDKGAGFGRQHLIAKADRFGDENTMAKKLEALLANSHVKGSPNHRVKRYYGKDPAEHSNLDYQMTWKDPSDGTIYVLGLEKHTQDRIKYAAITTFYPMDRKDGKNAGDIASESDVQEYMRMQAEKNKKFSVAPKKAWTSKYTIPEDEVAVPDVTRRKDGKWNGGPTGKPMTPRQVNTLVKKLVGLGLSERAVYETSHGWYENAGRVIKNLSHGDPQIMEDMLRVVAYLSADNSLGGNIAGAIDTAFDLATNGKITVGRGRYPAVMMERAEAFMGADKFDKNLAGVSDKVMSFYRNMRDPAYGSTDFAGEVTLDKWMFRAFGYKGKSFRFIEGQYGFGKMVMERVAEQLSEALGTDVLPRQAQAMVWTAVRNQDVDPANAMMVGFEHYFDRQDAVVTWEANPAVRTKLLPELGVQPMAVQREFARQAYEIITADGQDIILHKIGNQPLNAVMPGTGTFEGAVSPNLTTHIIMPRTTDGTYDAKAADLYANMIGMIYEQDAVPWHRVDPTLNTKNSNIGVSMMIEGEIDLQNFYEYMRTHAPSSEFSVIPRLDGKTELRFINFAGMPEKAYAANIETALAQYESDAKFDITRFRSTGNYLENEAEDGSSYQSRISEAGRSDLLDWAGDRRKAFHQLAKDWQERLTAADTGHSGQQRESSERDQGRTLEAPRVEADGTVLLHHWSRKEKIKTTNPNKYGDGFDGAEDRRRRTYPEVWEDRTYFGMNVGRKGGYVKEGGIGDHMYTSNVPYDKIYDWVKDPDGFRAKAAETWKMDQGGYITEAEKLIKKAGYWGYWSQAHTGLNFVAFRKMKVTPIKSGQYMARTTWDQEPPLAVPKFSVAWAHPVIDNNTENWEHQVDYWLESDDAARKRTSLLRKARIDNRHEIDDKFGARPSRKNQTLDMFEEPFEALRRMKREWKDTANAWLLEEKPEVADMVEGEMNVWASDRAREEYESDPKATHEMVGTVGQKMVVVYGNVSDGFSIQDDIQGYGTDIVPDVFYNLDEAKEEAMMVAETLGMVEEENFDFKKDVSKDPVAQNRQEPEPYGYHGEHNVQLKHGSHVNTKKHRQWRKNASHHFKVDDGSGDPRPFYIGTNRDPDFMREIGQDPDVLKHKYNSIHQTFISSTPEFASNWAGDNDTARVIKVYVAAKNIFDFRDPSSREIAIDFFEKANHWDVKGAMQRFDKGDFGILEQEEFSQHLQELGFDGYNVVENGLDISVNNPINFAIFNLGDIKSVFHQDPGNAADARYSVAPNSFENERNSYIEMTESDKTLWDKANTWRKRMLSPGGLLPRIAHNLKIQRDGMFHVGDDIIMRSLQSLETAVKEAHGKNYAHLTVQQKQDIDALLQGDTSVNVAPAIRGAVFRMRQDIDAMSDDYVKIIKTQINELRAEGSELSAARAEALERTIVSNKGKYVTRSYKMFDDPHWNQKIPEDVFNNALRYLTKQYNGNATEANRVMNDLIKGDNSAYNGMEGLIKESTLGAKDLTILMGRKNIAPEIRALMGENLDADLNYTRTMMKMNRLIHNTHFLNAIQEQGMGKFLFEENDPNRPSDMTMPMAGTNSKVLEPLNGLMTTPEIKQAFTDALGKSSLPQWLNSIIGINGAIKYGKVVLSPATQVRNFVSAPFFVLQSGTFDLRHMKLATSAVWDQIKARDGNFVEYYRDLVKKGVLYDTPNAGMLQDLLDDSENVWAAMDHYSGLVPETVKSKAKHYNNVIKKVYRGSDDFWKIVAYEGTKAQLAQAKPNWSTEQVEAEAAIRTRDTVPTYSLTGTGMKKLGRFPIVGSFVAFSSEIIRTSMNNLKIIQSDLKDPDLRPLAHKRIAGMAIAHAWAASASAMTAAMFGIGDDEEEAMRKLGSPWAENSSIAYLGRDDDGKMRSIDLSFVDPYNIFHKPLIAMLRDQPWMDSFTGAAREVLSPFFGLDIAAGALFELAGNSKLRSGAPIYNPEAPGLEQSAAIAEHLITKLGPGVVQPIVRIYKAANDIKTPQGRVYKLEDEIAGAFGLRLSTFDPKFAMYYRVSNFKEQLSNANSYLYGVASDINPVDDDDLSSAFKNANEIRLRAYTDMMQIVNAARASGLSTQQIRKVLRVSNVSKKYANALARGKGAPKWNIGRTFLKGATKRAKTLIDRETAQEIRRRKRLVQQIARDQQR
jgi:hypothetical protein